MINRKASAIIVALVVLALMPVARAQEAQSVTLEVSDNRIVFGDRVELSGKISPAAAGETVTIIDEDGDTRATAVTDDRGRYAAQIEPRSNTELHAQWLTFLSDTRKIKVKPRLSAHIRDVLLFGKARARGRLRPALDDAKVTVRLLRNGNSVDKKSVGVDGGGEYSTRFKIKKPGSYRTKVTFDDDQHLEVSKKSGDQSTPLPSLSTGSNSKYVKLLEKRLDELHYHITGINNSYDHKTSDAVIAFNKVQGRSRVGSVSESTWRAMADPKKPRPRNDSNGFHIEIDQTRQVVLMVKKGKVTGIVHTSTGANGATRDGSFTVHRKIAGYSGGDLYYPSYFDDLRALHGWPEVPTYPASHGCSRLPMWAAQWVFGKADIGTPVIVYH